MKRPSRNPHFLLVEKVCGVEGSMDFSCALDGSRESVKCQVKSAE